MRATGFPMAASLDELLAQVDVVADSPPKRSVGSITRAIKTRKWSRCGRRRETRGVRLLLRGAGGLRGHFGPRLREGGFVQHHRAQPQEAFTRRAEIGATRLQRLASLTPLDEEDEEMMPRRVYIGPGFSQLWRIVTDCRGRYRESVQRCLSSSANETRDAGTLDGRVKS